MWEVLQHVVTAAASVGGDTKTAVGVLRRALETAVGAAGQLHKISGNRQSDGEHAPSANATEKSLPIPPDAALDTPSMRRFELPALSIPAS